MQKDRPYDLEERTLLFSKETIQLIKTLSKNSVNSEVNVQLFRSVASVGANLREANESLGRKDFFMRVKISRKEAKEAQYWLQLLQEANPDCVEVKDFIQEALELRKILSSIIDTQNKEKESENKSLNI